MVIMMVILGVIGMLPFAVLAAFFAKFLIYVFTPEDK